MNRPLALRIALVLGGMVAMALLADCSGTDRISGNSVETENTVSARVIAVDTLLPSWNHPDSGLTVATLRLNATNFDFTKSTGSGLDLRVERLDSTALPFERVMWDSVSAMGRLHIRLDSSLLKPGAKIRIRWGRPLSDKSDPTATWAGISDSLRLALTSVLVDDFEDGDDTTLLPTRPVWHDYFSDSAKVSLFEFVAAGKGRAGKALHMQYTAPVPQYAMATTYLSTDTKPHSIRTMDSLVFWVRGTGNVAVAFDHLTNSAGPKAWTYPTFDTIWTRVRIRPQDLAQPSSVGNNIGWTAIRDSVTNLTFLAGGGKDIWIDDIRIYGIDRDDVR